MSTDPRYGGMAYPNGQVPTNPGAGWPYPPQANQPQLHWSQENYSLNWTDDAPAGVRRVLYVGPLLDIRHEWAPNDLNKPVDGSPAPAIGTYGNGRYFSAIFTGRLALVPGIKAWYKFQGAISRPARLFDLSQYVEVTDQLVAGGITAATDAVPLGGGSVITLSAPVAVRWWRPLIKIEVPLGTVISSVSVDAAVN